MMRKLKYSILAGLVPLVAVATLTTAEATTLQGNFSFNVYQGPGGGTSGSAGVQANLANPLINPLNLIGSGTITNGFFDFDDQNVNTVSSFLSSAGGVLAYTLNPGTAALSAGGFGLTSVFTFTYLGNYSYTGVSIEHDDGMSLYDLANNLIFGSPSPTVTVDNPIPDFSGPWKIVYVAANGLPEVLNFEFGSRVQNGPDVPLPAALPLLAAGLAGLGFMGRMRKRNTAA